MLQQTQVQTVLPFYERFLERFPDIQALAAAQERTVMAHWAGLGYYSRARNLHKAAKMVVEEFAGRIPDTVQELLRLPGVGSYTAGAIRSIGFNRPAAIVDGNVRRLIIRLFGANEDLTERSLWDIASSWTPKRRPSEFNQAVMELGALVCTALQPRCGLCPVSSLCLARRRGIQELIPKPRSTRARESVELAMLLVRRADRILLVRKPIDYIPGDWGVPAKEVPPSGTPRRAARELWKRHLGGSAKLRLQSSFRHAITHRRILAHTFVAESETREDCRSPEERCRWIRASAITGSVTSSLFRKALAIGGK
jgi:A/G-specific adenine glycosylase